MAAINEAAIRKDLNELIEVITAAPLAGKAASPAPGVYQNEPQAEADLDDSLNQLRLQVKYLLFDLEATRRENRYLRQMLENRHKRSRENEDAPGEEPGLQ
jgi:hypothetical protein